MHRYGNEGVIYWCGDLRDKSSDLHRQTAFMLRMQQKVLSLPLTPIKHGHGDKPSLHTHYCLLLLLSSGLGEIGILPITIHDIPAGIGNLKYCRIMSIRDSDRSNKEPAGSAAKRTSISTRSMIFHQELETSSIAEL